MKEKNLIKQMELSVIEKWYSLLLLQNKFELIWSVRGFYFYGI